MLDLSATAYVWIKALHIIAVITWMAGLLYLPRLFVYHAEVAPDSAPAAHFKVMERRLLRAIMNPSMIAALIFGGLLLANLGEDAWRMGWLHVKLLCVAVLVVIHMLLARWRRDLEAGRNIRSAKTYRIVNEIPALLMIVIVIMVIVRPF